MLSTIASAVGAPPPGPRTYGLDMNGDGVAVAITNKPGVPGVPLEQAVHSGDPAFRDIRIAYDLQAQAAGLDPAAIKAGSAEDKQVIADLGRTLDRIGSLPRGGGQVASNMNALRAQAEATYAERVAQEAGLRADSLTSAASAPGAATAAAFLPEAQIVLQASARARPNPATAVAGAGGLAAGAAIAIEAGRLNEGAPPESFPDHGDEAARYGQLPPSVAHRSDTPSTYTPIAPPVTPQHITELPQPGPPPIESFPIAGPDTPLILESQANWPITRPTGVRGGVPIGLPEQPGDNADANTIIDIRSQQYTADVLANRGYVIEHKLQGTWTTAELEAQDIELGKNPDFKVEGNVFDNYRPRTDSTDNIRSRIKSKVDERQAFRIIVDLSGSAVTRADLEGILRNQPIDGLREVITVDTNGIVGRAFP